MNGSVAVGPAGAGMIHQGDDELVVEEAVGGDVPDAGGAFGGAGDVVVVPGGALVVDDGGTVVAGPLDGAVAGGLVESGAVAGALGAGVVDGDEEGSSADVHPAGGAAAPVCPGMTTVPAHPKFENSASLVMVVPSAK